ncbi:probable cysteine--tRNA ligase, mitochondrial [Copidosoma floridanum]|uniref:probable cysteine--tRNA ligase, mitochondrial n=1 Tax=Copidosoma floridanum TaxID=29053 RepID=UPI000C6F7868|nr:probable cysteine--tRNA ligase, mitochondrial [Copidosoma floridanum]
MFKTWRRLVHSSARACNKFEWIQPSGSDSGIVVYNPVARKKTPLILRNNNIVTWYMCGPTVYDSAHIGHACTYVRFDTIRRILTEFFDMNVVLVMGMTDIDDKIIMRSNETGMDWMKLTHNYEKEFFSDMDSLNVLRPYKTCRVTDYIPDIIAFVKKIVDKNGAYVGKDGSVYFNTSNYKNYGKLDLPLTEDDAEKNPHKKSSLDFALWKAAKPQEPYWESPWGIGRPGWHIECSAMASAVLGNNIDIHTGGIDLAFPHHENEEAQSCCHHDTHQWVNYWMHTGHLHKSKDKKMSKSLKNTMNIPDLFKDLTPNQFRMLCLLSYYRNNIEYSDIIIQNAVNALKKIEFFLSDCDAYVSGKYQDGNVDGPKLLKTLEKTRNEVIESLKNDFHTPKAVHAILSLISVGHEMLHQKQTETVARDSASVAAVSSYLQRLISKLGITQSTALKQSCDLSNVLDIFIDFRNDIRNKAIEKDVKDVESLKACDNVRKRLSDCGVDLRDQKGKSLWTIRQ